MVAEEAIDDSFRHDLVNNTSASTISFVLVNGLVRYHNISKVTPDSSDKHKGKTIR